jgi:hypothetical protein
LEARIKDLATKAGNRLAQFALWAFKSFTRLLSSNLLLVLGTWALAVVGYLTMRDQHQAVERQLNEMQFEQRAWLYASKTAMTSPITFDVNGLRMEFGFTIRNTGKNPAVQVYVQTEAKIGELPNPEWSRHVCSMALDNVGVIVFPGEVDSIPVSTVTYLAADEIEKGAIPRQAPDPSFRFLPPITVMACVTYKDAATNKLGHTSYAFNVRKRDGLIQNGKNVPANQVFMELSPLLGMPPD